MKVCAIIAYFSVYFLSYATLSALHLFVDFGDSDATTSGLDAHGHTWNNIASANIQNLDGVVDCDGSVAEGVSLAVVKPFTGTSSNTSANADAYASSAVRDCVFVHGSQKGVIKIAGLKPSGGAVYDLKFFSSSGRQLPHVVRTDYTVAGLRSTTVSLQANGNRSNVATVDGVAADENGEIVVTVAKNEQSTSFGVIGVLELVSRAPSTATLPFPSEVEPGAWTIALIPDTQYYSQNFPWAFSAQTAWLQANKRSFNIRFALHVGDITNNNVAAEWKRARKSMSLLDGHMPYFFVPGNHDYGPNGTASTRETLMNQYFTYSDYSARSYFGGAKDHGKMDNTYHTLSAGGYDWIIMCLEWGPTDETIAWADEVLRGHPQHKAILVTHAYMYYDSSRYDHTGPQQAWNPHGGYTTPGNPNDGQELWDKLVKKHNFVLTVNGHVLGDGTGFRTDSNLAGQNVHQMLANYQQPIVKEFGGGAYLRLLTIHPDGTVQVKTYSPIFGYNTDADQQFTFDLEWYNPADTNANGIADYYDSELDSDQDGKSNFEEFAVLGSNPFPESSVEIVAHRGASKDAPENTIPAFQLAWEQGADAIEGDFMLSGDGHIVCIHDKTTERTAGSKLEVVNSTLAELKALDVGQFKGVAYRDVRIPTISEVFAIVPPTKKIYIELKCGCEIIPTLLDELASSGLQDDQVVVISFNAAVIKELKQRAPQYTAYWLCHMQKEDGHYKPSPEALVSTLKQIGADGLSTSRNVQSDFIEKIKAQGFAYHVWTVDNVNQAQSFKRWGAGSITTNAPREIINGFVR